MGRNLTNLPISASFQYLTQISGSELTDGLGVDIDSLNISASYATSASQAENANTAISASYATTASFALNVSTPSLQEVTDVGSTSTNPLQVATGGQQSTLSGTQLSTNGGSFTVTGGTTTNGFLTLRANDTNDVTLVLNGATDKITSNVDISAPTFTGNLVGNANTATSSSHAIFADTASFLPADTNLNINSITASNATFTSASIGYLQTITGSAKIIGDAFIILNNNTPTERYAGLVVQDSGSTNNTASLEFDGQTNDWFYEYTDDGGATTDHGVAMFGPEYNTKGAPVYNTANTLVKGDGGHHLLDSSITDDGILVTIDANVSASGYVSASSFIGDGSQITGLVTDPFPYTGSADITGSLSVIGDTTLDGKLTQGTGTLTNGSNKGAIIGATSATLSGNTTGQAIAGGEGNIISSRNAFIGAGAISSVSVLNSGIVAGRSNQITSGQRSFIGGGNSNQIKTSATDSNAILGGSSNDITAGSFNAIVAGTLNVNTNTRSVIVGGTGLSTTKDDEVVVEHLTTNGQVIGAVGTISDAAGTTTLDCSLGNYFTLAMPAGGSTTLTPSNITAGQTINIKITQNATAATLAYAASIDFPGGTAFTISTGSGEVDVLTLVSFDGTTLQATGLANFS